MKKTLWLIPVLSAGLIGVVGAGEDLRSEYTQRAIKVAANDVDAQYRVALWCQSNGLKIEARRHLRAVVTLEPDHRAARRSLGFEKVHGRWVTGKEVMRAKGFVEHDGVWLTPEEYRLVAKDEIEAKQAAEARRASNQALKRAWNPDPRVRAQSMAVIERLDKKYQLRPYSIASRINKPDVRRRAIAGLKSLNSAGALPPLYKRAIFDTDEELRKAAVLAIKGTEARGKIGPFVNALNSPFVKVRTHAAQALEVMGDSDAVGPLVARYQVVGGSGQSVYISNMTQISFVQDFDVEVAQTSFIADPVIGVIQDGLTLNFRVLSTVGEIEVYERPALSSALSSLTGKNLGDHPKAWAKWWKLQKQLKREQAAKD